MRQLITLKVSFSFHSHGKQGMFLCQKLKFFHLFPISPNLERSPTLTLLSLSLLTLLLVHGGQKTPVTHDVASSHRWASSWICNMWDVHVIHYNSTILPDHDEESHMWTQWSVLFVKMPKHCWCLPCRTATSPVLTPDTMSLSSHSLIW